MFFVCLLFHSISCNKVCSFRGPYNAGTQVTGNDANCPLESPSPPPLIYHIVSKIAASFRPDILNWEGERLYETRLLENLVKGTHQAKIMI